MLAEEAVSEGLNGGAAVVIGRRDVQFNFRLANNTLTTDGAEEADSATVIAIETGRVGVAVCDLGAPADARIAAEGARNAAKAGSLSGDAMDLLEPVGAEGESKPGAAPLEADPGLDSLSGLAEAAGDAIERSRAKGLRCFGYVAMQQRSEVLGIRTGLTGRGQRRFVTAALTLKDTDGGASVWMGRSAADPSALDIVGFHHELERRLEWAKRRVELPPGDYEVILEPSATSDLVLRLMWEMHARASDEGRTVFSLGGGTRVGEKMYSPLVTIESDPADPAMPVAAFVRADGSGAEHHGQQGGVGLLEYNSVFDNGLPIGHQTWVDAGVQRELVCPRWWAREHGHVVRPWPDNMRMVGTEVGLDELIADTSRGLLVASFWYVRAVDPSTLLLTGATRDGVFLIEKGEIVGAANNFRFSDSPIDVLRHTVQVGRSEPTLSREYSGVSIACPPIRVERFHMESVSPAV